MSEDNTQNLQHIYDRLEAEITKAKKANTAKIKIGSLVLLLMCILFWFVGLSVDHINSGLIVDYAVTQADGNMKPLKANLVQSAPHVVGLVSDKILSVPQRLRMDLWKKVDPAVDQLTQNIRSEMQRHIQSLKGDAAPNSKVSIVDQYKQVLDLARPEVFKLIDQFYYQQGQSVKEASDHLYHLRDSYSLNKEEQLQKKAISAWLTYLDHKGAKWQMDWE